MICNNCFEELKKGIIGQTNKANETATYVSTVPDNILILNRQQAIPLYITGEKPITKGAKKGQLKKIKGIEFIAASYCAKCGIKFKEEGE